MWQNVQLRFRITATAVGSVNVSNNICRTLRNSIHHQASFVWSVSELAGG